MCGDFYRKLPCLLLRECSNVENSAILARHQLWQPLIPSLQKQWKIQSGCSGLKLRGEKFASTLLSMNKDVEQSQSGRKSSTGLKKNTENKYVRLRYAMQDPASDACRKSTRSKPVAKFWNCLLSYLKENCTELAKSDIGVQPIQVITMHSIRGWQLLSIMQHLLGIFWKKMQHSRFPVYTQVNHNWSFLKSG